MYAALHMHSILLSHPGSCNRGTEIIDMVNSNRNEYCNVMCAHLLKHIQNYTLHIAIVLKIDPD